MKCIPFCCHERDRDGTVPNKQTTDRYFALQGTQNLRSTHLARQLYEQRSRRGYKVLLPPWGIARVAQGVITGRTPPVLSAHL